MALVKSFARFSSGLARHGRIRYGGSFNGSLTFPAQDFQDFSKAPIATLADLEKIRILREEGIAPETGRKLTEIAAEIWDHNTNPAGPNHRSGLKALRKPLKGPLYASWYPEPDSKNPFNPFKLTPKQERWKEKLKILRAAGKGPPKKGSGKRSK